MRHFNIPVVILADEPGFLVGLESEKQGIERAGARLMSTICLSKMPIFTVVISKVYGVVYSVVIDLQECLNEYAGLHQTGVQDISVAAVAYKSEIEKASDPEAKKIEIETRLKNITSPFRTAETTGQKYYRSKGNKKSYLLVFRAITTCIKKTGRNV